jgi:adenylate cyclase
MEAPCDAWLEVSDGPTLPLAAVCSIGRASSNGLVFADDVAVSRNHAVIQRLDGGGFWLLDLGSSNGTLLNGMLLVQPTRLNDADRIVIGGRSLVFCMEPHAGSKHTMAGSTLVSVRVAKHWLMVADIEGFTPMSLRLSSEDLAQAVGQWFARTREVVEECGGVIHKYLGDGWLSSWSEAPAAASRVADCMSRMVVLRRELPHKFRLILHFGDVTISGGREMMGPDMNFVFRMEKLAGSLKAPFFLSAAACERLDLDPPAQSMGRHALKGFGGSHNFHQWAV